MKTVARTISIVLHPFVTIVIMVVVIGLLRGSLTSMVSAVAALATIAILPVAVLILYKVVTGEWTTVDASRRPDRPALYAVSIAAALGLILYMTINRGRSVFMPGAVGTLGLLLFAWIVNRWVKLSLHMALAAMATTVLIASRSAAGWVLLALLPALAWSRLELKRHTPKELLVGAILGTLTGLAIYLASA
jgi:hypothetical protein